jgi:hypothetical protein
VAAKLTPAEQAIYEAGRIIGQVLRRSAAEWRTLAETADLSPIWRRDILLIAAMREKLLEETASLWTAERAEQDQAPRKEL